MEAGSNSPPEASRRDDRVLMKGVRDRDQAALATLYDRHASLVLGLCLRILRDRHEAEEVAGEVFYEIWDRAERFDPERGEPLGYIITLARSRALDRLRREKRRLSVVAPAAEAGEDTASTVPAVDGDPWEAALASERRTRVRRALAALTQVQREAVDLAYFAGLSHSEIAERLATPLGTIKTRIRDGLVQLKRGLDEAYGGEARQ